MLRLLLLNCLLLACITVNAGTIIVKNIDELNAANKKASPGDIIILQNGEWKNVTIKLNCSGTQEQPITFKAQTAGSVIINGNSQLRLGGNYIIVDGLYFTNGFAGDGAVINFRIDAKQLATNCRVTNTVINDFNNPKRMDENYWVAFYGRHNQLDHCSFINKKNMGVLLAVILDDERSRENFHSIDHNYFGLRIPLGSNGGEIIRVGVSQHCQFNSNTQIVNNYFEQCDGETEIVSIKSGSNIIINNVFKECQGSVVLRHGDYNTVRHNYFLGNDKRGTGGVRVINKGQKVDSNVFYKCRGVDFRSPLAIMNGIPNSPAHRYVQVTDAVIADNVFYECSPVTFCEGSDTERSLPPANVAFLRNQFYNTKDAGIYKIYDDIKGIQFEGNIVNKSFNYSLLEGFQKSTASKAANPPGIATASTLMYNRNTRLGAPWFLNSPAKKTDKKIAVSCSNAAQLYRELTRKIPMTITLTAGVYQLTAPLLISSDVEFTTKQKGFIQFNTGGTESVFIISGNGNLKLNKLNVDGTGVGARYFIANDSTGSSAHYNLTIKDCTIRNLKRSNGCAAIFYAYKYMIADSIIIRSNSFTNNTTDGFILNNETDNKGYYSAEKIIIGHNKIINQQGQLLNIYRGGNDESTMGPNLSFSHNNISNCSSDAIKPLLVLTGVQVSSVFSNVFVNANPGQTLLKYKDFVRADHTLVQNKLTGSGNIEENKYVNINKTN